MTANTILGSIAIMLIAFANAEYDVAKYCKLVKPGTILPSISSCKTYYICPQVGQPIQGNCTGTSVFSKNAQSCVPESSSNCYYDVSNPCENKHNQFAGSSNGCNWYNWCVNGAIVASATCPIGLIFNPDRETCVPGSCSSVTDEDNNDVKNLCEIMPDGVYFGDFKDCKSWFKCNDMNLKSGVCQGSLVFDVSTGMCLKNEGNMCERTKDVIKTTASGPPNYACDNVDQIVGDTNVCSIYYMCKVSSQTPNTTYQWKQYSCDNSYFDVISKKCNGTLLAKSYPGCDRCKFKSGNPYWANEVDNTCSKYITCNDGRQVSTKSGSCGSGNIFDEKSQVCIKGDYMLSEYATHNGACQDYKCTDARECALVKENDGSSGTTSTTDEGSENTTKVTNTSTTPTTTTTTTTTVKPDKPEE